MADRLPAEIWIEILCHPVLIGMPTIITDPPSAQRNISSPHRRAMAYHHCSLISRYFHHLLSSPSVQAQWCLAYNNWNARDAMSLCITSGWFEALVVLAGERRRWPHADPRDPMAYRLSALNDALVVAFCQLLPYTDEDEEERDQVSALPSIPHHLAYTDGSTSDDSSTSTATFLHDMKSDSASVLIRARTQSSGSRSSNSSDGNWRDNILQMYYTNWPSQEYESTLPDRVQPRVPPPRRSPLPVRNARRQRHRQLHFTKTYALAVVEFLLKQGADVQLVNNFGLRRATQHDALPMMHLLITHGANPADENHEAIHTAVRNGSREAVFLLLEHGAQWLEALREACVVGSLTVLRDLLFDRRFDEHRSEAMRWCRHTYLERIPNDDAILRTGRVTDRWFRRCWMKHPLVAAARHGHSECMRTLLAEMAVDRDPSTYTLSLPATCLPAMNAALRFATREGHLDIVCILTEYPAVSMDRSFEVAAAFAHLHILEHYVSEQARRLSLPGSGDDHQQHRQFWRCHPNHPVLNSLRQANNISVVDLLMDRLGIDWRLMSDVYIMNGHHHRPNGDRQHHHQLPLSPTDDHFFHHMQQRQHRELGLTAAVVDEDGTRRATLQWLTDTTRGQ